MGTAFAIRPTVCLDINFTVNLTVNPTRSKENILVFQLKEFLESSLAFTSLVTKDVRRWLDQIVRRDFRPLSITRDICAREKRSCTRSNSVEAPSWPLDWAPNKSTLRTALRSFEQGIEALRRLQEPPHIGTTHKPHQPPLLPDPQILKQAPVALSEQPQRKKQSTKKQSDQSWQKISPGRKPDSRNSNRLQTTNTAAEWVSDRHLKFMSDLCQAIFHKLGPEILISTAYHDQTDGQSERTYQTVEIALHFHHRKSRS